MKVLFVIFVIFMVSNKAAPNTDYIKIARDLSTNITTLIYTLSKVDDKVQTMHGHLTEILSSTNFGISQNPQIIELNDSLKKHQFHKQIVTCINLFNKQIQILLDELKRTFANSVDFQLNINKIGLFNARQELTNISVNLQVKLKDEIKFCTDDQTKCRLTVDYPNVIDKDTKYVNAVNSVTDTLLKTIFETSIKPTIPAKINTEVYKPVNDCINLL